MTGAQRGRKSEAGGAILPREAGEGDRPEDGGGGLRR
jgi:hypothetical protein